MNKAKVIQVIETRSTTGDGTKENPSRAITQYWDFQGNLLFTDDQLDMNKKDETLNRIGFTFN